MTRLRAMVALLLAVVLMTACTSDRDDADNDASTDFARSVDIGGRNVYLTCRGPVVAGAPTIVLISGYHDSSDAWTETTALDLLTPAIGPPVLPALATSHRVCAYDRPGTIRYIDGAPLTDRSTPVAQPRTTGGIVTELHDVLAAAEVKAPYVLVGHSLGGLIARAYAQAHTDQVRGVVFVDAFSATVPAVFGAQWPIYRDQALNPAIDQMPAGPMRDPTAERIDWDASIAEVLGGKPFPAIAAAVLTKTEPFVGSPEFPGLSGADLNRLYQQAQDDLVALAPGTPRVFATGSDHCIQCSQPDLVVHVTELVQGRATGQ